MSILLNLQAPEERYRTFADHRGMLHLKCDQHGIITSPDGFISITFEHAARLIGWHESHYQHGKEGERRDRDRISIATATRGD